VEMANERRDQTIVLLFEGSCSLHSTHLGISHLFHFMGNGVQKSSVQPRPCALLARSRHSIFWSWSLGSKVSQMYAILDLRIPHHGYPLHHFRGDSPCFCGWTAHLRKFSLMKNRLRLLQLAFAQVGSSICEVHQSKARSFPVNTLILPCTP